MSKYHVQVTTTQVVEADTLDKAVQSVCAPVPEGATVHFFKGEDEFGEPFHLDVTFYK